MNDKELIMPFYAKATIFIIGLFAFFTIMYIAQAFIMPIIIAVIIAIVLHPIVNFFVKHHVHKLLAIIITMLLTFIVISAFGVLIYTQASQLNDSLPKLVENMNKILNHTIINSSRYFDLNQYKMHQWISKSETQLIKVNTSSDAIGKTLASLGSSLVVILLVPVYVFMILIYQPLIIEFIRRVFGETHIKNVNEIISQTKTLIQRYILGLLFEALIVGGLYATGLLIIGIDYAILIGVIAGLLNIIPYIGGLIILILIMLITIATKDSLTYLLLVGALAFLIHIIDNSFIIPKIVASKVRINALISIIAVIGSSALFGISGMVICIPILGITKLIFDHIEPLKPWGFLLGDTMPALIKFKLKTK